MRVPFDVLFVILERGCTDLDPPAISSFLRSCSLVCQELRSVSQPLLFSEFTRHKAYYSSDLLLETLRDHPHLIPLVKCLWIDKHLLSVPSEVEFLSTILPYVQQLALFSNLTRVRRNSTVDVEIRALEPSFNNVTFLCLSGMVEVSVDVFNHFRALQSLCIRKCTFKSWSTATAATNDTPGLLPIPPSPRPRLTEITLEGSLPGELAIINWFLHPRCAFDLSRLKRFLGNDVSNQHNGYALVERFMERYAPILEDVLLCPADYSTSNACFIRHTSS
ncbi:hypothetical protein BDN72DRAFT_906775 [Pluteus cervinus]|uniref:Uncharacterized protein n=1 Tax=Pluteus cervinus TaxID=181527 RepID=A0ACD2ZXX3_9AGAR|nr:hypothetical protein BDN72DRAFT_906775 [Pluteus cervinus]